MEQASKHWPTQVGCLALCHENMSRSCSQVVHPGEDRCIYNLTPWEIWLRHLCGTGGWWHGDSPSVRVIRRAGRPFSEARVVLFRAEGDPDCWDIEMLMDVDQYGSMDRSGCSTSNNPHYHHHFPMATPSSAYSLKKASSKLCFCFWPNRPPRNFSLWEATLFVHAGSLEVTVHLHFKDTQGPLPYSRPWEVLQKRNLSHLIEPCVLQAHLCTEHLFPWNTS